MRLAVAAVAAAAALAGAGCGGSYKLPTEHRELRKIPGAGTYQMIRTRAGLNGIRDVLLTPGKQLFLLFGAPSPHLDEYPLGLNNPFTSTSEGLENPAAVCVGANHLFVLDQGDTAAARIDLHECCGDTVGIQYQADCGPVSGFFRPIANLSRYWHVREYSLTGVAAAGFTDTTFIWVNGIAADALGRVYVAGITMYCRVDPFDPRLRSLDSRSRIYRYERGPSSGGVIGDNWRRDPNYEVTDGTGIGSTNNPHGLQWGSAVDVGAALYFADTGNNEVQKFADPASGGISFKLDFGGSGADSLHLSDPVDVSVDSLGYIYVADLGNKRVLRYAPDGAFVQRVDIEKDESQNPLERPIGVTADFYQVYVADPAHNEVIRYRRRN